MKKHKRLFLLLLSVAVVASLFLSYHWLQPEILSSEEAEALVLDRYDTSAIETVTYNSKQQTYELTFIREASLYGVVLDGETGAIESLTLIDQQEEPLEEEEAKALLTETYDGKTLAFTNTELQDGHYQFEFTVDGRPGTAVIDAQTGSITRNTLEEETAILSPDRAADIALSAVPGTVDDIDQETRNDRLVYEVDIEDTGREDDALVIIDAYTGEVISVIWD